MDAEMEAIRSKEDIVSLHNGREWATFDGGVESLIGQTDILLQKVFRTNKLPLQVSRKESDTMGSHTNEPLEVLPYPRSSGEDNRPLRLPLQQLPHRQSCQHAHHIRHILSPCRSRHHHVPVNQHCCTCGNGCIRQHVHYQPSGY